MIGRNGRHEPEMEVGRVVSSAGACAALARFALAGQSGASAPAKDIIGIFGGSTLKPLSEHNLTQLSDNGLRLRDQRPRLRRRQDALLDQRLNLVDE